MGALGVQVRRGGYPDGTRDRSGHLGEDVPEEVRADYHVEALRVEHEAGGQGVGVHEGGFDIFVFLTDFAEDLVEERHGYADTVRFSGPDEAPASPPGFLVAVAYDPLDAAPGKDALLDGDLVRGSLV